MAKEIKGKHILVAGGAGFVGSSLCIGFRQQHPECIVSALDNLRRRGSELNLPRLQEHGVRFVHGDVRNAEDLAAFQDVDVIIDAAADPSVLSGIHSAILPLLNTNLQGTVNLLELANRENALFIFLSTSRVYPHRSLDACRYEELESRFSFIDDQTLPGVSSQGITETFPLDGSRSFYGATKLCSELLITEYNQLKGLQTIINRCGVLSGAWQMGKADQGIITHWLASHYFKKELSYIGYGGEGKQTRDVLHIDDLVNLVETQLENPELYNGNIYNAGGGIGTSFSLKELTGLCQMVTGNRVDVNSVPENRVADVRIYLSDCSKLSALSGWVPKKDRSILVADIFNWIRTHENDLKKFMV